MEINTLGDAWERGVTDIRYGDNLEINPFEVGLEYTVDLDKPARFIGQDALRRIADGTTPRRHVWSCKPAATPPRRAGTTLPVRC